jgi:hypothetical protein
MTYTQLAALGVLVAATLDLFVLRTRLLGRPVFWVSYAIIFPFQLITNGVLTGTRTVRYSGSAILGSTTPSSTRPAFLGDGRICYAPVEDIFFGFALILLTLTLWVWLGRRGVQRLPLSNSEGRPFAKLMNQRGSAARGDGAQPSRASNSEPSA